MSNIRIDIGKRLLRYLKVKHLNLKGAYIIIRNQKL
jgi:hypothetical protein